MNPVFPCGEALAQIEDYGTDRAARQSSGACNRLAPIRERTRAAPSEDFNLFTRNFGLDRRGFLACEHHAIGIADILFQLFESCALAEDARNLANATDEPIAIPPVLQKKVKRHI